MKTIRKSVFETNSSSTHSICVTKNNILDRKSSHVDFRFGEFGWEIKKYYTLEQKASYLYTALMSFSKEEYIEKVKEILDSNDITYTFEEPIFDNGYLENGYIDHSSGLDEFIDICLDEDKLMRYLFSSESFILTGNDNDEENVDINVDYEYDEYYKGN